MKTKTIYRKPLGNPDRKYRQDRFVISTCMSLAVGFGEDESDLSQCIRNCKELGFNLIDFIWASPEVTEKCIFLCEEHGIEGQFQNWDAFGGFQATKGQMKIKENEFEKFMEFNKKYKNFRGYLVWDEPLSDDAIAAAAEQVREIEKKDPKRLPMTIAIPSYNATDTWKNGRYEKYLRKYASNINPPVLSLDYYPFSGYRPESIEQLDNSNLFLDIALLRQLSLEMDTPMWFYIQAQDVPMGELYYRFTPERMTMQAYNVLLHGGKAVQFYCGAEGAIYRDGRRGPLFHEMKKLNHCLWQWGKTLMALTSTCVFHSPELHEGDSDFEQFREPLANSLILADEELPYRCSVGELEDREGNRYLIILNRDYLDARVFKLNLKKKFRVYEVSDKDGAQFVKREKTEKLELELAPGEASFVRLQDAKEEPFLIDYVLEK